jgi:hypothetical protein
MPKVRVEDLQEGMILGTDVVSSHGQVVLPNGIMLSAKHIALIQTYGIDLLEVDQLPQINDGVSPLTLLPEQTVESIKQELQAYMRETQGEWNEQLFQICLERKAAEYLAKGKR